PPPIWMVIGVVMRTAPPPPPPPPPPPERASKLLSPPLPPPPPPEPGRSVLAMARSEAASQPIPPPPPDPAMVVQPDEATKPSSPRYGVQAAITVVLGLTKSPPPLARAPQPVGFP